MKMFDIFKRQSFSGKMGGITMKRRKVFCIMIVLLLPAVLAAPTPSTKTLKNPNKYKKFLDKTRRKIETTVDYSTDILSSTVTTFTTQLVQNDNSKNSPPASLDNSNDNDVTTIQSEASSAVIIRNETGMDFSSLNIQQTLSSNGLIKTNEEFTVTTVSNKLITADSHDKIKHSGVDGITNSPLDSQLLRSNVEKPQLNEDLTVQAHETVIKQSTNENFAIEKPEMKHNDNLKLMENERDIVISSESFFSPTSTMVTKMPSNLENKKLKTKDSKKKYSKVQNTKKMKAGKKNYGNNDVIESTLKDKKVSTVNSELLENPAYLDDVLTTMIVPSTTGNIVATTHESIVSTTMEPKVSTQDTTQDITFSGATAPNIYLDIILYKGDELENVEDTSKNEKESAVPIEEMFPATTTTTSTTTTDQSTSIKTAPTTIKPTTLIHSKKVFVDTDVPEHGLLISNEGKPDVIELMTTTLSPLETTPFSLQSTENLLENGETTIATTVKTVSMDSLSTQFHGSESATKIDEVGDKIIILNANNTHSNEGVIVIDILEQVGSSNLLNNNHSDVEGFIINMDLIDNITEDSVQKNDDDKLEVIIERPSNSNGEPSSIKKDDIVLTTEFDVTSITQAPILLSTVSVKTVTKNDDIILINDIADPTIDTKIVWNEVKNPTKEDIKIVFDQHANLTLSNGELVIDNIYINNANNSDTKTEKADSLEIILVEDDSMLSENFQAKTTAVPTEDDSFSPLPSITTFSPKEITTRINENGKDMQINNFPTTIQIELPSNKHVLNSGSKVDESDEDEIKIKTTNKDSDTIFYISNTEVKVIENVPTKNPNQVKDKQNFPAIYEEDVIVDFSEKNRSAFVIPDKYEEDIVLSPLTSDFDPLKDINYIGEAFLDVEETQNGEPTENHHIIPLTSDVVIQPIQMKDAPVGMPIIGEPPQIELEEMVFNDDYDLKHDQTSSFKVEEFYPQFYGNQLTKSHLIADIPHDPAADLKNETNAKNKTLLIPSANINGTNTTNSTSSFTNGTAFLVEAGADNEDLNDVQTLFLACIATLTPLFLSVIVAFTIRHFWKRYQRRSAMSNDLISDKSTDPLAEKSKSVDELKSTESGLSSNRNCDTVESSTELLTATEPTSITNNHAGTNGSIFTMTLKNNHLIVETEERDDLQCDTRETKMHYSPSEKDGVFIVEAARGANQNGSYTSPSSIKPQPAIETINENTNGEIKIDSLQNNYAPSSSEEEEQQQKSQVQVHTPPVEVIEDPPKENPICNGAKTGLSQSDLSLTSSNSSNQGYTYGNHEPYQYEDKGYKGSSPKRVINIHCHNDLKPLIENSPPIDDPDKPKITAAIYKEDTINNNYEHENENGVAETEQGNEPEQKIVQNHKILNGDVPHLSEKDIIDAIPTKFDSIVLPVPPINGEVTLDSLSLLPPPPLAVDEISEQTILNLDTIDSLPPPPPNEIIASSES